MQPEGSKRLRVASDLTTGSFADALELMELSGDDHKIIIRCAPLGVCGDVAIAREISNSLNRGVENLEVSVVMDTSYKEYEWSIHSEDGQCVWSPGA